MRVGFFLDEVVEWQRRLVEEAEREEQDIDLREATLQE
jgi:hypothetical protein